MQTLTLVPLPFSHTFGLQRWSPQGRPWPRGHILKSLALSPQKLACPRLEDSTIF